MKTRIMIEAEVKFTVEYFEPTEGGMDSDQFGGEFDTVEDHASSCPIDNQAGLDRGQRGREANPLKVQCERRARGVPHQILRHGHSHAHRVELAGDSGGQIAAAKADQRD